MQERITTIMCEYLNSAEAQFSWKGACHPHTMEMAKEYA